MEEANTRQLVTRARKHVAGGRRAPVSSGEQQRLLHAFLEAARQGNTAGLESVFAEDVTSHSDDRGLVRTARVPVSGRRRVANFISALASHLWTGVTIEWQEQSCYSQRKTFAESAVQATNATTSAATSVRCDDHASPFHMPSISATA
jgi:hypothetical protein